MENQIITLFWIVYDILCKPEKWGNLLGNTQQIPTPGGKNGTAEDFTRHHKRSSKANLRVNHDS
jgi:hypothetical protein